MDSKGDEDKVVKKGDVYGNDGSRRAAEEYKQLLKDILT
jgi:hypothetical protein